MTRPALALALLASLAALPQARAEDFSTWPVLQNPFPSTGGGGWMIDGYRPVVTGAVCTTDFEAVAPDGTRHRNTVTFDAVPLNGGMLCTNGRWRSLENDGSGTTSFRVFVRDGDIRASP